VGTVRQHADSMPDLDQKINNSTLKREQRSSSAVVLRGVALSSKASRGVSVVSELEVPVIRRAENGSFGGAHYSVGVQQGVPTPWLTDQFILAEKIFNAYLSAFREEEEKIKRFRNIRIQSWSFGRHYTSSEDLEGAFGEDSLTEEMIIDAASRAKKGSRLYGVMQRLEKENIALGMEGRVQEEEKQQERQLSLSRSR
jgi:hypothetical protein